VKSPPAAPEAKPAPAEAAKTAGFPRKELVRFNVNWATGLNLGEAQISASAAEGGTAAWEFSFQAEAAIPQFPLAEYSRALATADLCTVESEKKAVRGKRKVDEKTTFDSRLLKATRETKDGGKSEMSLSPCAKDALTFLYFLRRELAAGRLPQSQPVYYGAPYQVSVQYSGSTNITVSEQRVEADRLAVSFKGPVAKATVEAFFARDDVRTPVMVRIPVSAGTIQVERIR
jgi:hypothetical protein